MTTPKIRGSLEEPRKNFRFKCRRCTARFENFDKLRFHAQTEHQRVTHQINRSLATIDAKLRSLQQLADEGMIGSSAGRTHSSGAGIIPNEDLLFPNDEEQQAA